MSVWWESLTALERVLACFAVPATLLLVLQLLLSLFGLGGSDAEAGDADGDVDDAGFDDADMDADGDHEHDGGHDADHDGEHGASLRPLTLRGVISFFSVFGWASLAVSRAGHPWLMALLVGVLLGAAAMFLVAAVLMLFVRLQADGTTQLSRAVGCFGSVYLTVPPARSGTGKLSVVIQDTLTECEAITDEPEPLLTGSEAEVIGVTREGQLVIAKKVPKLETV